MHMCQFVHRNRLVFLAATGLFLLLLAVFPANIFAAKHCCRACGELLWSLEFALDERLINATLAATSVNSLLCQASTCFRMGSKIRCIRSTPTEMQSMSEEDFECFASTAQTHLRQCLRILDALRLNFPEADFLPAALRGCFGT